MCAVARSPFLCASSITAPYRSGVSFLNWPIRSSIQILTMSTFFAASSCTALRASAGVVIQYGTVVRPGSGAVMPRPAVKKRATPGMFCDSARIWKGRSPSSCPRLIAALTP